MKRKISLALATVLAAGSIPFSVQAAAFRDLQETPWAIPAITEAVEKNLISGYKDQTFRGKQNVTKAECMTMLYNVLTSANFFKKMENGNIGGFYGVMDAAHIPEWARTGVLYGLSTGILGVSDAMGFYEDGKAKEATREDVAIMFGRALEDKYDIMQRADMPFTDSWEISDVGMPYVKLLSRLGIVSGDEFKRFRPKKPITRAEMAVMINKTYDLLADKTANQGKITEIVNHNGDFYDLTILMDNGETLKFTAMNDRTKIFNQDGSREISLSRFSKGDRVSLVYDNTLLQSIYLLSEEASEQSRYDVTGYAVSLQDKVLHLTNENTGQDQKYILNSDTIYYLDGKKTNYLEMQKLVEEHYNAYIYTGLMLDSEIEKEGRENVQKTRVREVYMTVADTFTTNGQLKSVTDQRVTFTDPSYVTKTVYYQKDCVFYLGDEKADIADIKKLSDTETLYVKVYMDTAEKATKVLFSADSFENKVQQKQNTFEIVEFSNRRITLLSGGEKTTYSFGSDNPLENISFYIWDDSSRKWLDSSFKEAEKVYDNSADDVYCRIQLNRGGKLSAIYVSEKRNAWKENAGDNETRKGTVASIQDGIMKFKASSQPYKMLNAYNVVDRDGNKKNELNILSAITSSSVVLKKMANSPDVTLYAEIVADQDHVVQSVKEAYLTYAKGKLVEYEPTGNDRHITIETSDGAELKLQVVSQPATGSADYTWEDVATTNFIGETVELGFNSNGQVSKITAVAGLPLGPGKRVEGMAVGAKHGLKLEGDSKVYDWTSDVHIRSKSFDYELLYSLKDMIEDPSVRLYIHAKLSDTERVESVNVTVKAAKGKLDEYKHKDHTIRIITEAGNTFTFHTVPSPANRVSKDDLEKLTETWQGKDITLEFNADGLVSAISK